MDSGRSSTGYGVQVGTTLQNGQPCVTVHAVQPSACAREVQASQATFQANINLFNFDVQLPALLRGLQQAAVNVLEEHEFDWEKVCLLSQIISDYLKGVPLTENHRPKWTASIETFVAKLHNLADHQIDDTKTGQVLTDLHLKIDSMLYGCLRVNLSFENSKEKALFILNQSKCMYLEALQKAFFDKEFTDDVCTLKPELRKTDDTPLSERERELLTRFLRSMVSSLTITMWMNLDDIVRLFDDMAEPPLLDVTISVTNKSVRKIGAERQLAEPDVLVEKLLKECEQMKDPTLQRLLDEVLERGGNREDTFLEDSLERKNSWKTGRSQDLLMTKAGLVEPNFINQCYVPTNMQQSNNIPATFLRDDSGETTETIVKRLFWTVVGEIDKRVAADPGEEMKGENDGDDGIP